MPDPAVAAVVRSYLAELETALAGVPQQTRRDLLDGIEEELAGLSPDDAAARIRELGDPEFVAAEARSQSSAQSPRAEVRAEPQWFAVTAALLVAFGGFVVPVLGTVAGIVMVWLSRAWKRRDKWVALLTPVAVVAILAVLAAVLSTTAGPQSSGEEFASPRIPPVLDVAWAGVPALYVAHVVLGIWLLVRARPSRAGRSGEVEQI